MGIVQFPRRGHAAASSEEEGGRKSSAVTAPPVASLIRAATSLPGHEGSSEQSKVTYEGAIPIASAKAERLVPVALSQSPSLLMQADYSALLKFSQDEKFSGPLWSVTGLGKTLVSMAKQTKPAAKIVTRFKAEKPNHFIRQWRKHRRLNQEQLASRVDMSTSSISQLENGKQGYTQATLEALADALQCTPGDLLMRNPLDTEAIWSIWEQLKPPQRNQAVALLKVLVSTASAA